MKTFVCTALIGGLLACAAPLIWEWNSAAYVDRRDAGSVAQSMRNCAALACFPFGLLMALSAAGDGYHFRDKARVTGWRRSTYRLIVWGCRVELFLVLAPVLLAAFFARPLYMGLGAGGTTEPIPRATWQLLQYAWVGVACALIFWSVYWVASHGHTNFALMRRALDEGPLCPQCGYRLRALRGPCCPECGTPIPGAPLETWTEPEDGTKR